MIFTKTAKLYDGTKVKDGSIVSFIDSDGETCTGVVRKRKHSYPSGKKGTLFFWNISKKIEEYQNAKLEKY